MRLVLASASPRRAGLLRAAGFTFETFPVGVDETVRPGEGAYAYVRRLAMEKSARALEFLDHGSPDRLQQGDGSPPMVYAKTEGGRDVEDGIVHEVRGDVVVIGADTAVVVHDEILGKPRDAAEA